MLIGYVRVFSQNQNPDLQTDALQRAGCEQLFVEKVTGSGKKARPEWESCQRALRQGDTLIVWRLDRLGRSLKDLVDIIQRRLHSLDFNNEHMFLNKAKRRVLSRTS